MTRAFHFVKFERLEDFFRLGWMVSIPNGPMHHHEYGLELKWICACPITTPEAELSNGP